MKLRVLDIFPLIDQAISLSKRIKRAIERKRAKKGKGRLAKQQELQLEDPNMDLIQKILALLAEKRTSTKSGGAGLAVTGVTTVLALWPFYDTIKAFINEACAQPDPADFIVAALVGSVVTGVTMFIAARKSKTPPNPGAL